MTQLHTLFTSIQCLLRTFAYTQNIASSHILYMARNTVHQAKQWSERWKKLSAIRMAVACWSARRAEETIHLCESESIHQTAPSYELL